MSIQNATTPQPSAAQDKYKNKGPARPEGSEELDEGQFCNDDFHVIATKNGWTMGSYSNQDNTTGFILTNGQSMFHFDVNGNIVLATGKPGQSGCGGKVIIHAKDHHEQTDTMNIHVRGNDDESERDGVGGSKSSPAYSLYVEGDVAIESQGGDIGVKGDNITLNAINTLTLRAGESVNIESGEGQGKINAVATDFNVDSSFARFTTSGGFYIDGSGEFSVNQKSSLGATAGINTVGDIVDVVRGSYKMQSAGDVQFESTTGHMLFRALRGGTAMDVRGDSSEIVGGKKNVKITGKSASPSGASDPVLNMELGTSPQGSLKIKAASKFEVQAIGNSTIDSSGLTISAKGPAKLTGSAVYLN
jgi:hypothetical protein